MNTNETQQVMEDKNKDQMKQETNEMAIAQKIKIALENSDLGVVITPIMFDPESFTPNLGVLVKDEGSSYTRKYTVTIKPLK
jgi:hypothetical protein